MAHRGTQGRAAKADEHWDRLLRTQADLENYRKRAVRERQDAIQSAQATHCWEGYCRPWTVLTWRWRPRAGEG
jgi:hypothetical protein